MSEYKKYARTARLGIRGESFFESLICEFAIPHQVTGLKDLGVDYICEWVQGDRPTGILFGAQVKTTASVTPRRLEASHRLNGLARYGLPGFQKARDERTLAYWRGLGFPVYLFVIVEEGTDLMNCFYERTSARLTTGASDSEAGFYKANHGNRFLAFGHEDRAGEGFARDLFIDHARWAYSKGMISPLDPSRFGLTGFPTNSVFHDLFEEYRGPVLRTHSMISNILRDLESDRGARRGSGEPADSDAGKTDGADPSS